MLDTSANSTAAPTHAATSPTEQPHAGQEDIRTGGATEGPRTTQAPIGEAELRMLWAQVGLLARASGAVKLADLERLRDARDFADAFGPLFDPTTYMRLDRQRVEDARRLLDATIAYLRVAQEITEKTRRAGK